MLRMPIFSYTIDLMPLVRLQSAARFVLINLRHIPEAFIERSSTEKLFKDGEHFAFTRCIQAIIALKCMEVWRNYTRDAIVNITVELHGTLSLTIEVNKDAKEDWMPWDAATSRESSSKQHRAAATMWKMRIGLGDLIVPNVVVASD